MALNCKNPNATGASVLVEYALACGDVDPKTLTFQRMGSMRGKDLTLSADTIDTTTDTSSGGYRSSLASFKTMEFTGDGLCRVGDASDSGQTQLTKHMVDEPQPVLWLRFTYPDLTFTAYMILTEMSRSAPNDDAITFSMTASVTDTGSEVIQSVYVEDTPVAPSSVTVSPASPTVKVGATTPLTATVLPSGASQTVTWLSASPSIATVNASTGVVTGVAIGSSVIMAKAGLKQGSVTVTVTAA